MYVNFYLVNFWQLNGNPRVVGGESVSYKTTGHALQSHCIQDFPATVREGCWATVGGAFEALGQED